MIIGVYYKNWKNEISWRQIIILRVYWGKSGYHTTEQYLMDVYDIDKQAHCVFSMKNVIEWRF